MVSESLNSKVMLVDLGLSGSELRSGGSYFSQNDMRLHFGLEEAATVDLVELRWLSGQVDQFKDNKLIHELMLFDAMVKSC